MNLSLIRTIHYVDIGVDSDQIAKWYLRRHQHVVEDNGLQVHQVNMLV